MSDDSQFDSRLRSVETDLVGLGKDCENKHESQQRQIDKVQTQVDKHELTLDGSYDHPGLIERVGANDVFRKKWVGIFTGVLTAVIAGCIAYFFNK